MTLNFNFKFEFKYACAGLVIALAMGEAGLPTRLLAPKFGGYLTFGALSAEKSSATGQPTIAELRRLYRVHSQTEDTKVQTLHVPSQ